MAEYYGTITITITGWFEADGIEEIQDDPIRCATNCRMETEIVEMEDWEE